MAPLCQRQLSHLAQVEYSSFIKIIIYLIICFDWLQVHSVESEHRGIDHNSVFYIPTGPDCSINKIYLRRMRHAFMLGQTPPGIAIL